MCRPSARFCYSLGEVYVAPQPKPTHSASRDSRVRADSSSLWSAASRLTCAHPGRSGVRLLPDGLDAFCTRVHSIRLASRTIDVQTYIWRDDSTGRFIAHELLLAADRGVHVRVLIDDMDARPHDLALEALDAHPSIEVRIFNPFRTRSGLLKTIAEVSRRGRRLNHRMHNKSWIVDGALCICGGRNLGDEYFSSAQNVNFIDLDLLMLGPAVEDTAQEFDRYWNCRLSVPIAQLRKYMRKKLHPERLRSALEANSQQARTSVFCRVLDEQHGLTALMERPFVWSANVRVIADDPNKALGAGSAASHVLDSMVDEIRAASREVLLISPYFVPGVGGTAALRALALQGASVRVLTNSLMATDVAIVHSGYAKYRYPLLEGGVRLYELKSTAPAFDEPHHRRFRVGSSRASLHTKAAIVDGDRVFVGSFNIDPRSAELNCEMGVWIRSKTLAKQLTERFREGMTLERAFELKLSPDGRIVWIDIHEGAERMHTREPDASWWRRAIARVLETLPIESQL